MKKCPKCNREIHNKALSCPYCEPEHANKTIDKRVFPRHDYKCLVAYKMAKDPDAPWKEAMAENISMGGMLFKTQGKLASSTRITVSFEAFLGQFIQIQAKVVESEEDFDGYNTRIKFINFDAETKNRLRAFLDPLKP
ncbi:MAG: PilZ domain-containing protein [Candidatus Omnitrophica bacterium]|nr:PilZ domain-containing protein [Candidatus Omnitrophota bacterium]MBU1932975.1 PilZ domain-containing protein [Candidatus Omnitrophota bacterium]